MPFGDLPTSGGGLRCYQLMRGLQAHGVEVIASMPGFTYLAEKHYDKIPLEQREMLWRWETQDEIFRRVAPDAVLFASNWDHFNLTKPLSVPLIIDLHGSRLIETTMWNNPVSTEHKVRIFSKADCFLCAGKKQRNYFYGWLLQAGRVPDDGHFIRYVPVSLSPDLPEHFYPAADSADAPRFVSGGGWFPWQNQSKAIFAVCEAVMQRGRGTIDIFGTPHETSNMSPEEIIIRDIYERVESMAGASPRIRTNGYIGREELIDVYRRASVAVEAMEFNLERELAFTTRTIEYFWCGLPVIYNDFGEIAGHIRDYNAGWTVDPADERQIGQAIEEIFSSPESVAAKGRNAQQLVKDRFSWDKTIQPLIDFLQAPRKAPAAEPAIGPVGIRATFLSPSGTAVDVGVGENSAPLRQPFIVPAEHIRRVETPVALGRPERREQIKFVELALRKKAGRAVARKRIPGTELPLNGLIGIDFPALHHVRGGADYVFEIRCVAHEHNAKIPVSTADEGLFIVRGLLEAPYPLCRVEGAGFNAKTLLGQQVRAQALALTFVPGTGAIYRIRGLAERAWWMVRRGEIRRLSRALRRRFPALVERVRQYALS
ncbi:MAG TPA: glycosyltransferase family 4 protein [Oligoflexia bacterium]|nr:glycosyltransferase family 4 protein [Oligoflexia bacterium]